MIPRAAESAELTRRSELVDRDVDLQIMQDKGAVPSVQAESSSDLAQLQYASHTQLVADVCATLGPVRR